MATSRPSSRGSASAAAPYARVPTAAGHPHDSAEVGDRSRVRNAVVVRARDDDGDAIEVARWDGGRDLPLERARMPGIGKRRPRYEEPGVHEVGGEKHHRRKEEVGRD